MRPSWLPVLWSATVVATSFLLGGSAGAQTGGLVEWGSEAMPFVEPGTRFVAVSGGVEHNLALKADGTVIAWGGNSEGQSAVPIGLASVIAIAAGEEHSLALRQDGRAVAWGYSVSGQTSVPATLSNLVAISAGGDFSLGLKSDGTVAAWGTPYQTRRKGVS